MTPPPRPWPWPWPPRVGYYHFLQKHGVFFSVFSNKNLYKWAIYAHLVKFFKARWSFCFEQTFDCWRSYLVRDSPSRRYLFTNIAFVIQICQPHDKRTFCFDSPERGSAWHFNDNGWRQRYLPYFGEYMIIPKNCMLGMFLGFSCNIRPVRRECA